MPSPACRVRMEGEVQMTSIEFKLGDRVRLNELGSSRSPKIKAAVERTLL